MATGSHFPNVQLNQMYADASFRHSLKQHGDIEDNSGFRVIHQPFRCVTLPDFLVCSSDAGASPCYDTAGFIADLRKEMAGLNYYEKNNDLYQLRQSDDLKTVADKPCINVIKDIMYGPVREWMQEVTGIPLSNVVDLTASAYEYTDSLLCHDDELDDRRVAFVLYLTADWEPKDGGTLDLIGTDELNQPSHVVKSILPRENMFMFFEVGLSSYHQVSEVLTLDKPRWSINGWYHGPTIERPMPLTEPRAHLYKPGFIPLETVTSMVNPHYFDPDIQAQIQVQFEKDSQIELQNFLQDESYNAILAELKMAKEQFKVAGPLNKRKFCRLPVSLLDSCPKLAEFVALMKSEAIFLILSQLTGLNLHSTTGNGAGGDDKFLDVSDSPSASRERTPERAASPVLVLTGPEMRKKHSLNTLGEEGRSKLRRSQDESSDSNEASSTGGKEPLARCQVDVRKWSYGCYTLLHDTGDLDVSDLALDAQMFFGADGWQTEYGGNTSYVAKGEDEELLTVTPASNSLALVYRDKETMRFVKAINCRSAALPRPEFFDVELIYYESVLPTL